MLSLSFFYRYVFKIYIFYNICVNNCDFKKLIRLNTELTHRAPVLQTMHEAEEKNMTRSHIEGGRGIKLTKNRLPRNQEKSASAL